MEKILILTEKKTMKDQIQSALSHVYPVTVMEIGGHIYFDSEADILKVSDALLKKSKQIETVNGEMGYLLGEDVINKNIEEIKKIHPEDFDVIVDFCDDDKSGDALFFYAINLCGIDSNKTIIRPLKGITKSEICENFEKVITYIKKDMDEVER